MSYTVRKLKIYAVNQMQLFKAHSSLGISFYNYSRHFFLQHQQQNDSQHAASKSSYAACWNYSWLIHNTLMIYSLKFRRTTKVSDSYLVSTNGPPGLEKHCTRYLRSTPWPCVHCRRCTNSDGKHLW